jgi:hypothetical protein
MAVGRRSGFVALALGTLLAACGGSGGGGGGGGGGPVVVPVVDVAVRGSGLSGPRIHVYRDVLHGAVSGHAPNLRIGPPASIAFMAFTGAVLVLGADFGMANQNRIWVYTEADLAGTPVTPSVQCLLPPPAGAVTVSMKDLVVHDGDLYVLSVYLSAGPPWTFTWLTHVFRNVATLPGGTSPDATITHDEVVSSALSSAHESLAVDDDVLLATGRSRVYRNLAPGSLNGAVVPDGSVLLTSLGLLGLSEVTIGGGEAYLHNALGVSAFADPAGIVAGATSRFDLQGPSSVIPRQGAILRLADRLFVRGPYNVSPVAIVGFDVGGPVPDFQPPDVMLGPPTVGDHHLSGAADTLVAASSTNGVVAVYARASLLVDGDEPSHYLWDVDVLQAEEVRAAER